MFMMLMMRRRKRPLASLGLLLLCLASASAILPPSKDDLNEISMTGEKYVDQQIENAIKGVKEMKTVMDKSSQEHQKFLGALEKIKQKKEEAVRMAHDMEQKLDQQQQLCSNVTVIELWEDCKPCLKNTCVKYYSRVCSSGSGMVGRQLEGVLNRTSPFSIWVNGKNMATVEMEDQQLSDSFHNLEDRYSEVADGVDSIFKDSMKVFDHMHPPMFTWPFRMPSLWGLNPWGAPEERPSRVARSPLWDPDFSGWHNMFRPMAGLSRNIFNNFDIINIEIPSTNGTVDEDVIITRPLGDGKMTCREIRRNSAGCIPKLRGECERCNQIQNIDCFGNNPLNGTVKKELEKMLALVEKLGHDYSRTMRVFEEQMHNTSSLLDSINNQFGWVSRLVNETTSALDGIFKVHTVDPDDTDDEGPDEEGDQQGGTHVSVQLFDSPPMTFTVPGDVPWSDPKFSELVAQQALDRYKESAVVVK